MNLILALGGPVLGGLISFAIWQAQRNNQQMQQGIDSIHNCVHQVEKKVDVVQLDLARNYITRDELKNHIDREEDWHDQHHQEVKELRQEFNEKTERLQGDIAEMKEMQWNIRMDQLEIKNKTDKM